MQKPTHYLQAINEIFFKKRTTRFSILKGEERENNLVILTFSYSTSTLFQLLYLLIPNLSQKPSQCPFCCFKTEVPCLALVPILELALVQQVGTELTESVRLCVLRAGIKSVHYHHPVQLSLIHPNRKLK